MKIDIRTILEQKETKLKFQTKELLHLDDLNLKDPLEISLTLTNIGKSILVEGTVSGNLLLACVHCLSIFESPFKISLCEEYVQEGTKIPNVDEETSLEELSIFTYGQDHFINPSEAIRQAILINLPMQPVCSPSCKGLCPSCGKNRNEGECGCSLEAPTVTEDRWAPLQSLKEKFPDQAQKRRNPRA